MAPIAARLYIPDSARGRVLLDAQHCCDPCRRGHAVFDGLRTEENPGGRQRDFSGPRGSGTRRHSPFTSSARYSSSDEHQVAATGVCAQRLRLVAGRASMHGLPELRAVVQRVSQLDFRRCRLGMRKHPGKQARCQTRGGPVTHREIELVDHQRLAGKALSIFRRQDRRQIRCRCRHEPPRARAAVSNGSTTRRLGWRGSATVR